jgi:hypothetical protein
MASIDYLPRFLQNTQVRYDGLAAAGKPHLQASVVRTRGQSALPSLASTAYADSTKPLSSGPYDFSS